MVDKNNGQDSKGQDEDTKKILAEMEAEKVGDEKDAGKSEEKKPEPKSDEKEPDEKTDDEEKGSDDKEAGDKEDLPPAEDLSKPTRTPTFIPLGKHQDKVRKLNDEIERLKEDNANKDSAINEANLKNSPELDKEITELAEGYGLDKSFVMKLGSIVMKQVQTPKDVLAKVNQVLAQNQATAIENLFEKEFSSIADEVKAEHPDATEAEIKTLKQRLHDLAFSEGNEKTSLKYIYRGEDSFRSGGSKRSAEESKGGTNRGAKGRLDHELSTAEISKLSDAEFAEYSANMGKTHNKLDIRHN